MYRHNATQFSRRTSDRPSLRRQRDSQHSEEAFGVGPYIRNCFVDCGQTTDFTKDFRALSMAWCKGGVVESNQLHNTKYGGPYQTATGARELVVRNGYYRNVPGSGIRILEKDKSILANKLLVIEPELTLAATDVIEATTSVVMDYVVCGTERV